MWRYWTGDHEPDPSWWKRDFDDSMWSRGAAPLGYGEPHIATQVSFGPNEDERYITSYFRTTFVATNLDQFNRVFLGILRDDGIIVYLNDTAVVRENLPLGPLEHNTLALTNVVGSAETNYATRQLMASLQPGTNVLAIAVHQVNCESADLLFDMSIIVSNILTLKRGPFLQVGTQDSIEIRWRTDLAADSQVFYGTRLYDLNQETYVPAITNDHRVRLTGLKEGTRYYYSIVSQGQTLAEGQDYYFVTAPATSRPMRIWVTGDTQTGDSHQRSVRDAYYQYTGFKHTDVWLLLGDNGGTSATDLEYQKNFFQFFSSMLRQTVCWPAIGNHDTYAPGIPYFDMFSFPTNAEAGGVPSGCKNFYSFDFGKIHFVCLDSAISDLSTNAPQYQWLQHDLSANTQPWLIAYWHHPPYSRGSHLSDEEPAMIAMRENFVPLLEAHGVDLVLTGHSHSYERSFLLDGHYGRSTNLTPANFLNRSGGRYEEQTPYIKPAGKWPRRGAVYVVAGSSGLVGGGPLNHPAMYYAENNPGSLVLDIDGDRLDATFLREDGKRSDGFTLLKGATPTMAVRIQYADGTVVLTWNTTPGNSYNVWRRPSVSQPWNLVVENLVTLRSTLQWIDPMPFQPSAYYRVQENK